MRDFSQIVGYDEIKKKLDVICDILENTDKYKRLGITTPRGLLLSGYPGVGKTTIANTIIKNSNRKSYTIRKTKKDKDFLELIETTFAEAKKNAPSIVLLDDLDKFSDASRDEEDTDEYVSVQSQIDDCKDFEVFVIATVNRITSIPKSLTREGRIDETIEVAPPQGDDAKKIIAYYLSQKKNVGNIDIELVTRLLDSYTCAGLESIINIAGVNAAYNNKDTIETDDIIKAFLSKKFDIGEAFEGKSNDYKKIAAYHESGHTIVAEHLEPGSVDLVSINNYYGDRGGITSITKNVDYWHNLKYMENRVIILLAGRATSKVFLNMVDTGSGSDVNRALDIIERIVDWYGTYGFSFFEREHSSDDLRSRKDISISLLLDMYYRRAEEIVYEYKDKIEAMAKELLEKEYLTCHNIKEIMQN